MFENKLSETHEIHYSRYIASWINEGGHTFGKFFIEWLKSIGLTETEIRDIRNLATDGKLELEASAKKYVHQRNYEIEEL